MRTLIKNVDILTLDSSGTVLKNASIAIEGKTIVAVGDAPPDFAPDEVIDGYNHVAVPGFCNAHCHAAMTYERGWAEDLPFPRWLNEKIWVAESALQPDDVYWGAALWGWWVDGRKPDARDWVGAGICLVGAAVIA